VEQVGLSGSIVQFLFFWVALMIKSNIQAPPLPQLTAPRTCGLLASHMQPGRRPPASEGGPLCP